MAIATGIHIRKANNAEGLIPGVKLNFQPYKSAGFKFTDFRKPNRYNITQNVKGIYL